MTRSHVAVSRCLRAIAARKHSTNHTQRRIPLHWRAIQNCVMIPKRILFVLGGPGSGKGTQCAKLVAKYGFVHLSAGDLLREERQSGSENGDMIDRMIKEGQIVPVEITLKLLQNAMSANGQKFFLIDGFPRNFDNLQGWKNAMPENAYKVEGVLFYDCTETVMESRLLERAKTSNRTDDNAEAIRKRFLTYLESTMPVIDYYAKESKVLRVDAAPSPEAVFDTTCQLLDPLLQQTLVYVNARDSTAPTDANLGIWISYDKMCIRNICLPTANALKVIAMWLEPHNHATDAADHARRLIRLFR